MSKKAGDTVKQAAAIVMIGMIVSRILGYGRYKVIAYYFGRGWQTDAFLGAFAVPDLLYILSSGGALGAAFIPLFSGLMAKDEPEDAWRMASGVWNVLLAVVIPGIIIGMFFAPYLTDIIVPGFRSQPETRALCIEIMRVIFPMVIFTATSALANGILQSMDHYTTPAIAWTLHNIGIITAAILLHNIFGIKGLAFGVLGGAFSMVAVQVPAMARLGMRYIPLAGPSDPNVRRVLALFLPAMLGLSISQINLFILPVSFGSVFSKGSVTSLQYGVRLLLLPLGVFGNALAMAVFPTLSAQAAGGKWKDFHSTLSRGIRATFVFSLPCATGFVLLGLPIVRLLFGGGQFNMADCIDTAAVLMFYAFGLVGHTAIQILSRGYYALQDTRTPFLVGLVSVLLIIIPMGVGLIMPRIDLGVLALHALVIVCWISPFYWLGVVMQPLGHQGVALSVSLAALFNMVALLLLFRRRKPDFELGKVLVSLLRIGLATAFMGAATYGVALALDRFDPSIQVLANVAVSGVVFFVACRMLKVREIDDVLDIVIRRFRRKKAAAGK